MTDDEKRQKANRQREQSRQQVQRNVKLAPAVSEKLDELKAATGFSLSDLLREAFEIAEAELRKRYTSN